MAKRGAKQALAAVRGDRRGTGADLLPPLTPTDEGKGRMVPGMIADGMPPIGDLPHHIGIFLGSLTDHKKGGVHAMPLQNIEQTRREFWMGAIVKGKGSDGLLCSDMRDCTKGV
jgi:hypothetical protein